MVFGKFFKNNCLIILIGILPIITTFVSSAALKLDDDDVDTILNDPTKRAKYVDCLRGAAPCTEDGKKLKEALKDVIKTNETNSVEEIKIAARRIYDYLVTQVPNDVRNLAADVQSQNDKFWDRVKDMVRKPINWLHGKINDDEPNIDTAVVDMYQDGPTIVISSKKGLWNNNID